MSQLSKLSDIIKQASSCEYKASIVIKHSGLATQHIAVSVAQLEAIKLILEQKA
jgi:hypothetical protein